MSLAAYLDELGDIPALILSHGLKRLVRKGGEFVPSVAAIRREAALVLRETHRAAQGLEPAAGLPPGGMDGDLAERWLKRSRDPLPERTAALPAEIPATPEQRARGAALLESLVAGMRAKP